MEVLGKYNSVPNLNSIKAIWGEVYDTGEGDERCSWQFKTDIPHSTFRIMEDGELFCVGIVFNISDLSQYISHRITKHMRHTITIIPKNNKSTITTITQ